jgi:hypothetical protein
LEFLTININKSQKRNLVLFSIVAVLVLFTSGFYTTSKVNGSYSTYMHEGDTKYLEVEDLVSGNTYDFDVTYSFVLTGEMDVGFSVHLNRHFKNPVVSVDTVGTGFEYANYTAPYSGNFYIKVWMTEGDTGSVEITVTEQGTLNDMDINYSSLSFVSQFLWLIIMLGVVGVITIFSIIFVIVITAKAINKQKERVMAARASGEALPRAGRKKDKCPFCGVKLPPESLVTCPYCGAPITE